MHEGFFGWSLENVGKGIVETKYIIESITDEKTWNFWGRRTGNKGVISIWEQN